MHLKTICEHLSPRSAPFCVRNTLVAAHQSLLNGSFIASLKTSEQISPLVGSNVPQAVGLGLVCPDGALKLFSLKKIWEPIRQLVDAITVEDMGCLSNIMH